MMASRHREAAARLGADLGAFRALLAGLTPAQARRRPARASWCVLEVVNHLADEEAEDFRARLRAVLEDPNRPWPPIDPKGWVSARAYRRRTLGASFRRFERERAASISWLRGLKRPAWGRRGARGLRAGDLLASWLAHDLLHLRQLARLRHQALARASRPYRLDYAGPL